MLVRVALRGVVLAVIFYVVDRIVDGITVIGNENGALRQPGTFLWIALIFAVVNTIIGPVIRLLSLPFVVLTLGLFLLVINAALLGLTALFTDRLQVNGFLAAVLGGLLLAIGGWAADQI